MVEIVHLFKGPGRGTKTPLGPRDGWLLYSEKPYNEVAIYLI